MITETTRPTHDDIRRRATGLAKGRLAQAGIPDRPEVMRRADPQGRMPRMIDDIAMEISWQIGRELGDEDAIGYIAVLDGTDWPAATIGRQIADGARRAGLID